MHLIKFEIYYFINEFNQNHLLKINNKVNLIFRNYEKKFDQSFYKKLKNFCHLNGFKIYLANNTEAAYKLGFNGVYLSAFNRKIIHKYKLKRNFKILGSAHNLKELKIKEKQNVDLLFLSPVFKKKNNKYLGVYNLLKYRDITNLEVAALGGINMKNLRLLKLFGIKKFASIELIKNTYDQR